MSNSFIPIPIPIFTSEYPRPEVPEPYHPYRPEVPRPEFFKNLKIYKIVAFIVLVILYIAMSQFYGKESSFLLFVVSPGIYVLMASFCYLYLRRQRNKDYFDQVIRPQLDRFMYELTAPYELVKAKVKDLQSALKEQAENAPQFAAEVIDAYESFFEKYSELLGQCPNCQPEKTFKKYRLHMYEARDFANQVLMKKYQEKVFTSIRQ
jgi:hypothetical protein